MRVLFSFGVSDVFGEVSEVVSKFSHRSRVIWLESHPKYLGVSALVVGSDILGDLRSTLVVGSLTSDRSFGGASRGLLGPKFSLVLGGFRSSPKDCFAIASDAPGGLLPAFCCSHLETKKVLSGFSPSIQQALKSSRIYSCSVGRRGKHSGNIEEFVSGVLRVIYYRLTLSHSDFAKCRTRLVWLL